MASFGLTSPSAVFFRNRMTRPSRSILSTSAAEDTLTLIVHFLEKRGHLGDVFPVNGNNGVADGSHRRCEGGHPPNLGPDDALLVVGVDSQSELAFPFDHFVFFPKKKTVSLV